MAILNPPELARKTFGSGRTLLAVTALIALLYFGRNFFVTIIISAVFAFLLDPVVVLVTRLKMPRAPATFIVITIALVCVYLLATLAWTEVTTIKADLPTYSARVNEVVDGFNAQVDDLGKKTMALMPKALLEQQQVIQQKPQEAQKARRRKSGTGAQPPPPIQEVRVHKDAKPVIGTVYEYLSSYLETLLMISFMPFLVYFMLSWRDHMNRRFLLLFAGETRYVVGRTLAHIGDATRGFVLGNFLLWVFLSVLSAISFFALGLPYWPLIGILSAFLSLVPYAGLALSLLPPVLAAVAVPNNFKIVAIAILITAALHLVSMNLLYAKIVGRRVRLNPLVITIAMMFWGVLWGAIGLVLAIPITAAIKAVCDNVETLEPFGRLLGED